MNSIYAAFIALDLFFSALTGGKPYQTISARLAKSRNHQGVGTWFANAVDVVFWKVFGIDNHCDNALKTYEFWLAFHA